MSVFGKLNKTYITHCNIKEKVWCVKTFYQQNNSAIAVQRAIVEDYKNNGAIDVLLGL